MCTNPEKKKLLNINNLIAEIQKIKKEYKKKLLYLIQRKQLLLQGNGT